MRAFLLSTISILTSFLLVSFNTLKLSVKSTSYYIFRYTGTDFYQTSVENPEKWTLGSISECDYADQVPCVMIIDGDFTDVVGGVRRLKATVDINSVACVPGFLYFVNPVNPGDALTVVNSIYGSETTE